MKKRIVALFLAVTLGLGLMGCGNTQGNTPGDEPAVESTQTDQNTHRNESGLIKVPSENTGSSVDESTSGSLGDVITSLFSSNKSAGLTAKEGANYGMSNGIEAEACEDGSYWMMTGDVFDDPGIEWNTEEYKYLAENTWLSVKTSPFSTFAADVDTASYANLRRMLTRGQSVPADAVRIEEMVNYFHYDYPQPKAGEPFSVTTEMAPCPWNSDTVLFMVGLAAKELDTSERVDSNLVFLIDVSGSMDEADKLPLVQRSFKLLCEELRPGDRVSIVTYASGNKIVIDGASGEDKAKVCEAIEDLFASGGTNGSAGIQTAYELAEKNFIKGGNNRVILATDGDLNIGITDEGSLVRLIEDKAKSGVFLSVLGFGWGNISDARMEALADHGNGNYSYIDNIAEARKVLIEEMGSTLFTVAKDVKLQVEFNPSMVKGYRLIGYENRTMAAEDFSDDTKDGGEIGAGHQVTALYEVALKDSKQEIPEVESRYSGNDTAGGNGVDGEGRTSDGRAIDEGGSVYAGEYLTVNIRYKEPDGDTSKLLSYPVDENSRHDRMSENLSWAAGVAQAGMILKKSAYLGTSNIKEVTGRLDQLDSTRNDDYRKEFVYLFSKYVAD